MAAGAKPVAFDFPLKGLDSNFPAGAQPRLTSRDLMNVWPFDPGERRARGGRRPGLTKVDSTQLGGGDFVQGVVQAVLPARRVVVTGITYNGDTVDHSPGAALVSTVNAVASATWRVSRTAGGTNATGIGAAVDAASFAYRKDSAAALPLATAYESLATPGDVASCIHKTQFAGDTRAVSMKFYSDDVQDFVFNLYSRVDNTYASAANVVFAKCTRAGISLCKGTAPTVLRTFAFPTSIPVKARVTLTLTIDGDQFTAKVQVTPYDSVLASYATYPTVTWGQISATSAGTNTGYYGFGLGENSSGDFAGVAGNYHGYMHLSDFLVYEGVVNENARNLYLAVAAGGNVYLSQEGGGAPFDLVGAAAVSPARRVSMAVLAGVVYIADGIHAAQQLDLNTRLLTTQVASVGALPSKPSGVVTWRGRLVYFGVAGEEQNAFMSRPDDPSDWQYGQDDVGSAVALNLSNAGGIGQPIYALIPYKDDVLLFGCDHSIYALAGDPAADGAVTTASEAIGMMGRDAWTTDPAGTIYFMGTTGFYRMSPGGVPENLTAGSLNEAFRAIDRSTTYIACAWDASNHGCWIFLVPIDAGDDCTAYWYDARTKGFFPATFPALYGPTTVATFDGDGALDRYTILGGTDGYLRKLDVAASTDDGVAIDSYVFIGPVNPFGQFADAMLHSFQAWLYSGSGAVTGTLHVGASPEDAYYDSAPTALTTWSITGTGKQARLLTRARGAAFYVKLAGSEAWVMERLGALAEYGGPSR